MSDNKKIFGVLVEFNSPTALLEAATKVKKAGYKNFDCHTPFPVHGLDQAMGMKRSRLGYIVGASAIIGFSVALILQWWTSSVDYPLVISGKPFFSYQAFVPVTFALSVLFSAIAAILGMLTLNRLPMFFHPLFSSSRFKKVTDDGFFISIEASDKNFNTENTKIFLASIGGNHIEVIYDES